MKYDSIIMGAGLAGLMSAHALAAKGRKVLVLERGRVAGAASSGLVGALAPHMPENWNAKKQYQFESMMLAEQFWRDVERRTGQKTGYQKLGRWQAIWDETGLGKAKMRADEAQISWQGEAHWRVINAAHPFVHKPLAIAEDNLSAQIFPRQAILALLNDLRARGVEILENCALREWGAGFVDAGEHFETKSLVLAGGYAGWPFLRRFFGAEFGEGVKGQAALIALKEDWRYPMITGDGYYVVPHSPRLLGIGSTSERYWHEQKPDAALDALLNQVRAQIALPEFEILERWAGIRPRAYRPDPLIGKLEEGVFVNAGGFKTGFSFANKLALDLAEFMDGNRARWPEKFDVEFEFTKSRIVKK